ncbi:MAG TPA: ATP-binding cassette domain-containing protein [Phycisphaerae bacterium]|nr:ATP-binding cassette domain-containing protein [Phycisphaerae bacterium]
MSKPNSTSARASAPVLALDGIHFSRESRQILTDVTWSVAPKQIAAILGANGCGKSTLLRIACAYLWPQKGTVKVLGETLGEVAVQSLRARIGIVDPTTIYPFDENMSARDVVVSGYFSALTIGYVHPTAEQWGHAEHLLAQVGLGAQRDQNYFTLSTGQRMRALIARALVRRPELLILDEPTTGLDLPARETILATLARLHKEPHGPAMITVTHHLEELLPDTRNILLLSTRGTVITSGSPEKVLTNENLSAAYNMPIHVSNTKGRYHAHVDPNTWADLL